MQIKVHDGDAVYFGGVGVWISPVYTSAIATTIGNVGLLFFTSESVKGKRESKWFHQIPRLSL